MNTQNSHKKLLFRGAATAMITPFSGGNIDFSSIVRMVDYQLDSGISALVVCGTTGEAPTLTAAERTAVIAFVAEHVNGRVPVIAGAGTNDTATSVAAACEAARAGADGIMAVTPYYNKPTQDGLLAHFTAIADAIDVPLILYNVPSRTGVSLAPEACEALSRHENIVAIKEASGTTALTAYCMAELGGRLAVYSGCDELTLPLLSLGANGVISVTSNVYPRAVSDMCRHFFDGDTASASRIAHSLRPLTASLFAVSNPIPVKAACSELGLCKNELRLPLLPMGEKDFLLLRKLIEKLKEE